MIQVSQEIHGTDKFSYMVFFWNFMVNVGTWYIFHTYMDLLWVIEIECKTQWPGLDTHNYRQNLNQPRKQHKQAAPPNQLVVGL